MSRVIGLDHGSRRIGVAVGDTETGMAFVRPAIRGGRASERLEAVLALARLEAIDCVVVGLPLTLDGGDSAQTAAARDFGERLTELGVTVVYEDERLSTWAAGEELREGGRRPDRRSGELDSTAARLILQQYLDARRTPGRDEETE